MLIDRFFGRKKKKNCTQQFPKTFLCPESVVA